jgi:hypothetical protein
MVADHERRAIPLRNGLDAFEMRSHIVEVTAARPTCGEIERVDLGKLGPVLVEFIFDQQHRRFARQVWNAKTYANRKSGWVDSPTRADSPNAATDLPFPTFANMSTGPGDSTLKIPSQGVPLATETPRSVIAQVLSLLSSAANTPWSPSAMIRRSRYRGGGRLLRLGESSLDCPPHYAEYSALRDTHGRP